ncbi:hypothetical protein TCAL_07199 [Tigriopus californicus]|uniref:Uncharacterized protein n=1 Tax=Tigriopus californicus TaxID=6832 RepID=A0A553NSA0_TIGCA|nr:uncharacterized protein LOC131880448 [Tigriopus californicus]TRY68298.1 hypothetical protein TCAL_07199 [Tigriopus californicus]|eukprot:TCALIF_07199-PA protein Name:"Similar to Ctif CBP80/20-dependent translation initiation factor (Mus musculus)" AED:0.00 eAED:0.00 QI:626/1/1/1/1/1/2/611/789
MSQEEPQVMTGLMPDVKSSDASTTSDCYSADPSSEGLTGLASSDSHTLNEGPSDHHDLRPSDSSEGLADAMGSGAGAGNGGGRLRRLKDSPPMTQVGSGLRRPQTGVGSGLLNLTEGAGPIVQGVMALPWWGQEEKAMDLSKALALKVRETCQTVKHLTDMMYVLHSQALESETFGFQVAFLFGSLSQLELEGVKCRNIFLRKIQDDFSRLPDLEISTKLNLVTLLCQVFRRVRVADGTTIDALSGPIMTCLMDVLDHPTDSSLIVFSKQVQIVGPELQRIVPEKFSELLKRVRLCLIRSPSSNQSQALSGPALGCILLVLELSLSRWKLTHTLEDFFAQEMPTYSRFSPMDVSNTNIVLDNLPHVEKVPCNNTQEKNLALLAALALQQPLPISSPMDMRPPMILPDVSVPPPNFRPIHPGNTMPPSVQKPMGKNYGPPAFRSAGGISSWDEDLPGEIGNRASHFVDPMQAQDLNSFGAMGDSFLGRDALAVRNVSHQPPGNNIILSGGLGGALGMNSPRNDFGLMESHSSSLGPPATAPAGMVPWSTGSNERHQDRTPFGGNWSRSNSMKESETNYRGKGLSRRSTENNSWGSTPSNSEWQNDSSTWNKDPTPPIWGGSEDPSRLSSGRVGVSDWSSQQPMQQQQPPPQQLPPPMLHQPQRSNFEAPRRVSSFTEPSVSRDFDYNVPSAGGSSSSSSSKQLISGATSWSPVAAHAEESSGWGTPPRKDTNGSGWGQMPSTVPPMGSGANGNSDDATPYSIDTWGESVPNNSSSSTNIHVSAKPWDVDD